MSEILNYDNMYCPAVPIITVAPVVIDTIQDNNLFEVPFALTLIMICQVAYVIFINIFYYGLHILYAIL